MDKTVHVALAAIVLAGFIGRVILSRTCPDLLARKPLKILPHVVDTLLLISGVVLVFQGHWLEGRYDWILAKLAALFAYIAFGTLAMKRQGPGKWAAFAAALLCFVYIAGVAVSKQVGWF